MRNPATTTPRRLPLWPAVALCLSLPLTVQTIGTGQAWWDIALGRFIQGHGIPAADPFTFLATAHPWVAPEWLFQVVLAGVVHAGGAGLASLVIGLVASLALVVAALAVPGASPTGGWWRTAAVLAGAATASPLLGVNGNSVTLLGAAATLLVVRRWREGGSRSVWLLPPLFLVWANCDPGFVAGLLILAFTLLIHRPARPEPAAGGRPGLSASLLARLPGSPEAAQVALIGAVAAIAAVVLGLVAGAVAMVVMWALLRPVAAAAAAPRRPLLIAALLAAAATLLTPAGPRLYTVIAATLTSPAISQLATALQTPNFHNTFPRLIEVVAGLLVLAWMLGRPPRTEDCLLATALFLAALEASGAAGIFAVVAIPQLAEYGASAWAERGPAAIRRLHLELRPLFALGFAAVIALASVLVVVPRLSPSAAARAERDGEPAAAAAYALAQFPGQPLLTSISDAGYLAYRSPAGHAVFVDESMSQFTGGALRDYTDITQVSGDWRTVLQDLGIRHAVLVADGATTQALIEAGWTVNCYDPASGRAVLSAGSQPAAFPPPLPSQAPTC
ncbi:MAG: hypothetical protein ABSA40_07515 [Candidatus Dormibacteria bacterium]|jgi:hypothetical protein